MADSTQLTSLDPVLRVAELRDVERAASDMPLMERAGEAAAAAARDLLGGGGRVLVLAGPGNNGGDAFVVARHLRRAFFDVLVVFAGDAQRLSRDAAAAHAAYVADGGPIASALDPGWRGALVVDGMFGIGLTRPLGAPYADWTAWVNESGMPVLALDVPSGLDAETGAPTGPLVRATATSTFIALKPGLLTAEGPDACGSVYAHALGLEAAARARATGHRVAWAPLARSLPEVLRRERKNVHKGTFGTLGIIGGAPGMIGAPLLAGRAALRVGAGRVRVGYAARSHPTVDFVAPELMAGAAADVLDKGADVFVVGPGLGADARSKVLLQRVLALATPLVLDADALNLIAKDASLRKALRDRSQGTLLTPHPAEAARLMQTNTASVQADRLETCLALARDLHACVVLKGAGSVLAAPDGRWDINVTGNSGLSAAGSGDVLAGFAGAMLSQHLAPYDALRYAVCLHGAAADALVARGHGPLGILASELADAARDLLNEAARAGRAGRDRGP